MDRPYAISLTTIPPRFDRLGPVLRCLLAQVPTPAEVLLCVPQNYDRFPGAFELPAVPEGVTVLRGGADLGPGMKAIKGARYLLGRIPGLIYCDDDWLMGPDWARHLLNAKKGDEAVAGQGFNVDRLRRVSTCANGYCDIAQGFSGVLADPLVLAEAEAPTEVASRVVDDIWLSAHMAGEGIAIRQAPLARHAIRPAFDDGHGLQGQQFDAKDRAEANLQCVAAMASRYGIWPDVCPKTAIAARG